MGKIPLCLTHFGVQRSPTLSAKHLMRRLVLDKIPTNENLTIRGVQRGNKSSELCKESEENVQHLFFSCYVTKNIWDLCKHNASLPL